MRVGPSSVLDRLAAFAADHPNRCVFRRGADRFALDNLERITGIPLDPGHRALLERFDGGFISPFRDIFGNISDEARSANCFLGVNAIARALALLRERYGAPTDWRFLPRWEASPNAFRYVPLLRLACSEDLLVSAPVIGLRPVLNAGRGGPHQWGVVNPCVDDLIATYVERQGAPCLDAPEPADAFERDRWSEQPVCSA